ncbi:hypothetical protein CRE_28984 [Caenorhabditis remanei]|uniref:F-box domain-containing protein n=1 Tax=Caenorhabditis remanei TaxID=31234 RepID=E3N5C4_CAERE|nr:hypothetical protein CRE_28984 [Caenorhabditis remanei]
MTTPFPVLRLPYLVLMPILEHMEFMERIALSILSKRARMFVKLIKMKCKHINLRLEYNTVKMSVCFDNDEELKVDMFTDRYKVDLRYGKDHISWWPPGTLSPMDYVLPIMDVTNCKSIKKLIFREVSEYDAEYGTTIPLLTKLSKIDEVIVEDFTSYIFSPDSPLRNVLKIVLPVSSAVTISDHVQKPKYLREILKGNFDAVSVQLLGDWRFPLNDLRKTNAKTLKLDRVAFKVEDLNQYFKMWMKKKCNPRLEYLSVRQEGNVNKDLLLKGLNAVPVPIETKRAFRVPGNVEQLGWGERIVFEFDITRADGRRATIRIGTHGTVCFYVWPEFTNDTTNLVANQSSFMRRFSWISNFYNSFIERFK